jgi:hypothetical protein
MPYGSDISQGGDYSEIAFSLSNPQTAASLYTLTDYAYDVAINGQPFFMQTGDATPYRRATAQYRKEQYDQTREAGEQSLTGWWFRSQSSFHLGQGIKYFEPAQDESLRFQYTESKGLDVWTKGQATLLRDTTQGHQTTGDLHTNLRPFQYLRSIRWTTSGITYDGVLLHDEYDVDKIDSNGNVVHFIDYNAGINDKVYAICDDGTTAYWITNDSIGGKLQVWKKALSLDSTSSGTLMFDKPGITVTNAVIEHVKGRLVMCVNNKIYEITPSTTTLPTEIYTNPEPAYSFTSITESGSAIYVSGYNGIQSTIVKFILESDGGMPTLAFATTAAEMPSGEIIYKIYQYLGFVFIGTSRGIRLASINADSSLNYGRLVVETDQPCYDFAPRGAYVWCATGVETSPGTIRLSIGDVVGTLAPAYAYDVYYPSETNKVTTACAFFGDTNRLCFTTKKTGATDGYAYYEHATNKVTSGYLQTGYIRYNTLEDKIFKFISPRVDTTNGAFTVSSIGEDGAEYNIGGYAQNVLASELGVPYPTGTHQYLGFKFTLNRSSSDSTKGPLFTGYQLKALPAVLRQRLIQYPLMCYDRESDSLNNEVGYDGRAFDRLTLLEEIENAGDTIRVQDFRTGESYIGLIEEMDFRNVTSVDKRFSGFGGVLLVTVRTV